MVLLLLLLLLFLLITSLFPPLVNLIQRGATTMQAITIAIGGAMHYFNKVKRVSQRLLVFLFLQPALLSRLQETFSRLRRHLLYFPYHPGKESLLVLLLTPSVLSSLLLYLRLSLFHSPLPLLLSHHPSVRISLLLSSLNPSRLRVSRQQPLRQHLLLPPLLRLFFLFFPLLLLRRQQVATAAAVVVIIVL